MVQVHQATTMAELSNWGGRM